MNAGWSGSIRSRRRSCRDALDPGAKPRQLVANLPQFLLHDLQLFPFGANEPAVRRDALADAIAAALNLLEELLTQRCREAQPHVGNLPPHLLFGPGALR